MAYDANFNNALAIWAAFGGRGKLMPSIPILSWKKLNYNNFGYTQYGGETRIDVYDNGNAQIAVYYAKTPYMSYYNKSTKQWTVVSCSWWGYGIPEILWAGDGVFIAKITGMANVIGSYDGITWYNAGYCKGAKNAMTAGAYDVTTNCSIVSWWYYMSPLYYSTASIDTKVAWTLVGADGVSVPIFKYLTAHKGLFVGVVSGDKSIAVANSSSPASWTTTIADAQNETGYMYLRSIHGNLFVMRRRYVANTYQVNLCVLNDSATEVIETNLSHTGDLADNHIPNPQNIIWMEDWGKYALFSESKLYASSDGLTWEGVEQPGFTTSQYETFGGAIYIPGKGFYVKGNDYVYFADY